MTAAIQEENSSASLVGLVDPVLAGSIALVAAASVYLDHYLKEHSCLPANYLDLLAFGGAADTAAELADNVVVVAAAANLLDGEDCFVGQAAVNIALVLVVLVANFAVRIELVAGAAAAAEYFVALQGTWFAGPVAVKVVVGLDTVA